MPGAVAFFCYETWIGARTSAAVSVYRYGSPVALLILRQALDFSYKEELVTNSLADYILQARSRRENPPTARKYEPQQTAQKTDPVLREEMVERIASSIRQTAATGSHFSKMLSPEEEEIMREIIREFME